MKWIKKGQIFNVSENFGWMNSHAQIPTVLKIGETLRIFFSTRTVPNKSKIGYLDVEESDPKKILKIDEFEVINSGEIDSFDEHGVMPSCAFIHSNNKAYLYYSGWSRKTSFPYSNLSGLAISVNSNLDKFEKKSTYSILTRNLYEPYSATSPFIILNDGVFYAYYCSGTAWLPVNKSLEHVYDIKLALSEDGIIWSQNIKTCIKQAYPHEAITRPTVIKIDKLFHMWFCYRSSNDFRDGVGSYKIGYAYSIDLINWIREDSLAGISLSNEGWDSKMICYPYVVETKYGIYMFYNGNGFGKDGFGYAILRKD